MALFDFSCVPNAFEGKQGIMSDWACGERKNTAERPTLTWNAPVPKAGKRHKKRSTLKCVKCTYKTDSQGFLPFRLTTSDTQLITAKCNTALCQLSWAGARSQWIFLLLKFLPSFIAILPRSGGWITFGRQSCKNRGDLRIQIGRG